MKYDGYQLQFWNGTQYERGQMGTFKEVKPAFDACSGIPRRLVLIEKDWPLQPKNRALPRGSRGQRASETVIREYRDWAQAHGVKPTEYYSPGYMNPREHYNGSAPVPDEEIQT